MTTVWKYWLGVAYSSSFWRYRRCLNSMFQHVPFDTRFEVFWRKYFFACMSEFFDFKTHRNRFLQGNYELQIKSSFSKLLACPRQFLFRVSTVRLGKSTPPPFIIEVWCNPQMYTITILFLNILFVFLLLNFRFLGP